MPPSNTSRSCQNYVRSLYGIADADASGGAPLDLARALISGGCSVVQLRCKSWDATKTREAALALRQITRDAGVALVVNDSPHLAAEIGADGLHLGQLDGPIHDARAMFSGWIGRSTHSLADIAAALEEGADYIAFGPVFDTDNVSRPKGVRGLEPLRQARSAIPAGVPLVAIGGITADRLPSVQEAGADAWAIIGAIATAPDPVAATRALLGR